MPGPSRTSLILLVAGAVVIGGPATADAQSTPAVIHACYVPLTGTVYRIKEPGLRTACSSTSHVEFSWTDGDGALRSTDAAAGDLSGSLATPRVAGLQGRTVSNVAPASGQVLTYDGTQWVPTAAANSGVVNGSFVATGAYGSGPIPATGAGTRMMWYPAKAAFRAGRAVGAEWDDFYVGQYSMAVGYKTTACGYGSTATGISTFACGLGSVAMGSNSRANNDYAIAIGPLDTASGHASLALGYKTVASGGFSTAMGFAASTNGMDGSFVIGDNSTLTRVNATAPNQFVVRAQHMWFGTNNSVTATSGRFLETSTGAYLSSGGVWTNVSDVNRKHLFEAVSGDDILARLAELPITEWSYKTEDDSVRHLGPTAQDFYSAFHLGSSDTSIGTIDADGVSLLAIQALEKRTRELQSENTQLRSRLDALEAAVRTIRQTAESQP